MDFKDKIAELVAKETAQEKGAVEKVLENPPKGLGDYAYPCFVLAKDQKKSPVKISKELAGSISADFLEKVESKGPYVNFFVAKADLSSQVLEDVFSGKGIGSLGSGKVMIEYSSPNTNKPLHVGHLRNNALGLSISNLFEATGHEVIKANLINDRGIHICKSMLAYKLFGEGKTPEEEGKKPDHFVGDMYVLYNEKLEQDSSLEEKAKEMLNFWEQGDEETIELWKKMNEWAISGMKETYKRFGSKFDVWFLESEIFKKDLGRKVLEEGMEKGIFVTEGNGAIKAVLEPELPDKILVRGDSTSLYITNDLGLTQYKFDQFSLDKSVWVVASEQDLYFQQLFKIFEKIGKSWAKKCSHASYGMVNLTSGKMKSREGTVIDADDLMDEVEGIAREEIEKRYESLEEEEKKKRASAVALSAIKFYLLKNDAKKEILFEPKKSISFEGETGPYLQYTYARGKSILRKAPEYSRKEFEKLTLEREKELVKELGEFNDSVKKSWEILSPHPLAHKLLAIAEKFNSFYHEVPVIKAEEVRDARLSLVEATTLTLKKGLELLDIEAIEEM